MYKVTNELHQTFVSSVIGGRDLSLLYDAVCIDELVSPVHGFLLLAVLGDGTRHSISYGMGRYWPLIWRTIAPVRQNRK
jgi:hypothetical protein